MAPETLLPRTLLERQARWLAQVRPRLRMSEQGLVAAVGDGVAWIRGLPSAAMEEVVDFAGGGQGLVFQLAQDRLAAVLLHPGSALGAGSEAYLTGRRLSLPVGDALLGRVIDPLGLPLDGLAAPDCPRRRPLDVLSPPLLMRDFVTRPLLTGTKVVDAIVPIGRGQRQLIVGDNGTGKTALAVDAVLNQRDQNVRCVYVLIAQKNSTVAQVTEALKRGGALAYTTVVVAGATDLPALKYLAPFAGCAAAEEWMWNGHDTLVVYDDLSTHARAFRELSLLLRRPPGREAYPADIFYLHARLLERATCLSAQHGGGSMTALPLVETKLGELAAYVPTNLISITDGQIYLDRRLFASGVLPAIDVTRSVSRIGGRAQPPPIKEAAGKMKLDYLQFLELEVFTRFGSRLEAGVEKKIRRGRVLRELLKQERLAPVPATFQLAWLTAFNAGLLDDTAPGEIAAALKRLERGLAAQPLALSAPRDEWRNAAAAWLAGKEAA